jgi:hypothetical protein
MTDSRITIPGQNVSFVLSPPWELRPPWDDPATQRELGVYVAISETTFCLHVRARPESPPGYPPTSEGIERYLFDQGWASPPFDILDGPQTGSSALAELSGPRTKENSFGNGT